MSRRTGLAFVLLAALVVGVVVVPRTLDCRDPSPIVSCKARLIDIAKALFLYQRQHDELPRASGARFLAELAPLAGAAHFTCPGVDSSLPSYAVRDNLRFPLASFPGPHEEILVADGNQGGSNHRTCTIVLRADGSIESLDHTDPRIAPLLDKEGKLVVGPDSPLEELRKLSLD